MPTIKINTSFGFVEISYSTREELDSILKTIPEDVQLIENTLGHIRPKLQRLPKPGFESAYRFTEDGKLELLASFPQGIKSVTLALHAYHPEMLSAKDIETITGIEGVKSKVIGQTNNKKYFRNDGDLYGLSDDGIQYVVSEILSKLPRPTDPM